VKYDHVYTYGTDAGTPSNPHTKYGGGNIGSQYGEPGYGAAIKYGQGTKSSALHYDNLSRITEYTDFFGNQYHYGYDELTRPAVVQYPNGIITQHGYDTAGRLHNITHKRESGETLRSFTYQYDLNRNITKITNEDGSYTDYTYDDWNRLTREIWKNAIGMTTLDIVYSFQTAGTDQYGDTGNICSKTVTRNGGTPETTTFTYDEYNKLTTINHPGNVAETLTYNANGQLTRSSKSNGEATSYYWNDQGFLTKVLLPSGEPVEYKYDGVGRLVGRKDADGEQVFVQSGWSIMTEQDTEGRRTYYTGSSSQNNNSGEANFFLFNHRGDTVLITDQTGEVSNSLHYEAYGKVTDNTGTPIPANSITSSTLLPPLFVGAYGIRYDRKTELSYMRFRWYSLSNLRFISADKIGSINRYSYANGNPLIFIDPLGLWNVYYSNGHIYAQMQEGDRPSDLTNAGYLNPPKFNKNTWDITADLQRVYGKEFISYAFKMQKKVDKVRNGPDAWKLIDPQTHTMVTGDDSYNCLMAALGGFGIKPYRQILSKGKYPFIPKPSFERPVEGYLRHKNIKNQIKKGAPPSFIKFFGIQNDKENYPRFIYTGKENVQLGGFVHVYYPGEHDYHFALTLGLKYRGEGLPSVVPPGTLVLEKNGWDGMLAFNTLEFREPKMNKITIYYKKCK
jgi:RHS repeat-associated protein